MRMVGGGDVKMAGVLMLFMPSGTYALFGIPFSAAMLLVILAIIALRAGPALRRLGPVSLRARGTFPIGLAFGLSGGMHLGVLA